MNILHWYHLEHFLYRHHVPLLPLVIQACMRILWATVIHPETVIGDGTLLALQGLGIAIHRNVVIGKNCTIGQNVTIGGRSGFKEVPVLGDNVYVGVGANILGPIRIGNNVTIGAGAVVLQDLPDNCVAVGVPARIVKYKAITPPPPP